MPSLVRYEGSGEWSALYVDGRLDVYGDHYLIEERISELCGVETIQSDSFMMGNEHIPATSLGEVDAYESLAANAEAEAERLEAEAERLRQQARVVRNNFRSN